MKYRPKVGKTFELKAKIGIVDAMARAKIGFVIVVFSGVILLIGVIHGLATGDFVAFQNIWAIISMPLGAVLGHYFGGREGRGGYGGEEEEHDEGSA
jgi:uncharacterized membrane-anchored protein